MKQLDLKKLQNRLRDKFLKSRVKMIAPETIYFSKDTKIGKNANIGAGTITCNYDGVKKSKTKIKDEVFIGSNTSLVAPVTINEKSIVGAGSVITKSVSKKSLALTRASQTEIKNSKRKK